MLQAWTGTQKLALGAVCAHILSLVTDKTLSISCKLIKYSESKSLEVVFEFSKICFSGRQNTRKNWQPTWSSQPQLKCTKCWPSRSCSDRRFSSNSPPVRSCGGSTSSGVAQQDQLQLDGHQGPLRWSLPLSLTTWSLQAPLPRYHAVTTQGGSAWKLSATPSMPDSEATTPGAVYRCWSGCPTLTLLPGAARGSVGPYKHLGHVAPRP